MPPHPTNSPLDDARKRMNDLGRRSIPFVVLADFELEHPMVVPVEECSDLGLSFSLSGRAGLPEHPAEPPPFFLDKHPMRRDRYQEAFETVRRHLVDGNTYLVNLTFPTPITISWTLEQLFVHSDAPFRVLLRDKFVAFSPERFVRIAGGVIATHPMKGTINALLPGAESLLLDNAKEADEHATVVDLLRNDLSTVAKQVRVTRYRYIESIATHEGKILQTSSEIIGDLPPDYGSRLGDIFTALLPAGSVTGAPKRRTVDIIKEAERGLRGYYTGVFGLFDGKTLDSCVLIRYIERTSEGFQFRSGGGITHASDPDAEYHEMIAKVYVPLIRDYQNSGRSAGTA
jgi:para-aminobenzoate synthetase component 1